MRAAWKRRLRKWFSKMIFEMHRNTLDSLFSFSLSLVRAFRSANSRNSASTSGAISSRASLRCGPSARCGGGSISFQRRIVHFVSRMSEVTFLEVGLFSRWKLARRCDATATMEIRSEWKLADGLVLWGNERREAGWTEWEKNKSAA